MSKDFHVECSSRIAALIWFASSFMCAAVPPTWINQTLFLLSANLICHILATSWPPDDWLSLKRILVNWEFKRTVKPGERSLFSDQLISSWVRVDLICCPNSSKNYRQWITGRLNIPNSGSNLRTCTLCEDRETEEETGISIQFASSCVGRGNQTPESGRQGFLNFQTFAHFQTRSKVVAWGEEVSSGVQRQLWDFHLKDFPLGPHLEWSWFWAKGGRWLQMV